MLLDKETAGNKHIYASVARRQIFSAFVYQ